MIAIAFYTITGQTARFVDKIGLPAHQIEDSHPQYDMGQKYVLILPSYQDFMMDSVVDFLNYGDNKKNLIGLIGCGNRNFNDLFAQTAKKISVTLNIPILYLLELSGNSQDVNSVRQIIEQLSRNTAEASEKAKEAKKPKELGKISFLSDYRQ